METHEKLSMQHGQVDLRAIENNIKPIYTDLLPNFSINIEQYCTPKKLFEWNAKNEFCQKY